MFEIGVSLLTSIFFGGALATAVNFGGAFLGATAEVAADFSADIAFPDNALESDGIAVGFPPVTRLARFFTAPLVTVFTAGLITLFIKVVPIVLNGLLPAKAESPPTGLLV